MARIKWSERRFDFSFPVELYPELLERLRGTPARLADRLAGVAPERLIRRPPRGWSIQEHAGHLADLDESLFLPRLDEYALGVATLRAADMTNQQTEAANHNARIDIKNSDWEPAEFRKSLFEAGGSADPPWTLSRSPPCGRARQR